MKYILRGIYKPFCQYLIHQFQSMSKVTIQVGFYLESQHYAQMEAFLPKIEALKISQLKIQQRAAQPKPQQTKPQKGRPAKNQPCKSEKSQSKKIESEEQIVEEQDENINDLEMQQEDEVEEDQIQDEPIVDDKIDSQKQQENLMRYLEDDDSEEDDLDEDDLSSISRSLSVARNKQKTKRQKGDRQGLQELPDRRPRKDKKLDEATQIIRRQQKERKRKQYLKKQVQAQQKATLDKILNETGRKLKLREQKQNEDQKKKEEKKISSLGDVQKITTIQNKQGTLVILHKTELFPESMTREPQIKIKPYCNNCGTYEARYKIKNSNNMACSLGCYKLMV